MVSPSKRLLLVLVVLLAAAAVLSGCATTPEAVSGGPMSAKEFVMATVQFFCMALIVYFLLVINPSRTREDDQRKFLANLKKNDEVITSDGIFARVVSTKPEYITVEIAPNVRIRVLPSSLRAPRKEQQGAAAAPSEEEKPAIEVQSKEAGKKKK